MRKQLYTFQTILFTIGILLLFWWPLSHWFYPVWYHKILGFENTAQYADNALVKVIGTAGLFPVLLLFFIVINPIRNRDMLLLLIINCMLWALTFLYLIQQGQFPKLEYWNTSLFLAAAVLLAVFYHWIKTTWPEWEEQEASNEN